MYSNIIQNRQWSRLACFCRYYSALESQKLPQNSSLNDGISPPLRIPRSPTDILQALAATVGPDPTAAHYKYHDDPYLIPLSNFRKRAYALSAEAGRKAAAWIRDEHPELFTTREWDPPGKLKTPYFNADPHIDAYAPRPIYNDESQVSEKDLIYTIKNALLEDSIKVYQLLSRGDGVDDKLKISFLQLLCFYNEKEPDSMEWLEERWFSSSTRERQATTWKLGGLADKIFDSMENKTSQVYCAIIQGMAKYYQAERAHALCQEAIENGIQLSTSVYNSLLGCIGFLREGTALRIEALQGLLKQMDEQGLSPNEETLTACLRSLSSWGSGRHLQQLALQLVAEFRQLGLQPSLSAYYYLLCLFCKERGPRIDILTTMLTDLEARDQLEPKEATDTNFFITAMGVCSDHLQNMDLAERVHALLMKDNNYRLVGDAYKESIYYRHFVTVACRNAPFERTLELLDTLVPNVYVPEPSVMEEIIKTLEVGGAGERLAQAWSQLIVFGHASRVKLIERLVAAIHSCYSYQENDVKAKLRTVAKDIVKFGQATEEEQETKDLRSPPQKLSATTLCTIMEVSSDVSERTAEEWDTVRAVVERLRRGEAVGVPAAPAALVDVSTRAAVIGYHGIAADVVSYLAECGFEEAVSASEQVLSTMLNRPSEEVRTLLEKAPTELAALLHPAALVVAEAYHAAKTGATSVEADSSTSSESDSESSDDE